MVSFSLMTEDEIVYTEKKDYLTQCYTRDSYLFFLWRQTGLYESTQTPFTVLLTDCDHFKYYNDKFGHTCGDELLKYYSSSLRLLFNGEGGVAFRLGGDEFLIVFPGKTSADVRRLAIKLKRSMRARPCLFKGRRLRLTFSGGIACFPKDGASIEALLENADKAMYAAKKSGRNAVTEYGRIKNLQKTTLVLLALLLPIYIVGSFYAKSLWDESLLTYFKEKRSTITKTLEGFKPRLVTKLISFLGPTSKPTTINSPGKTSDSASPAILTDAPTTIALDSAPDSIYLVTGSVIKGKIVKDSEDEVVLQLELQSGGSGNATFSKSKISKIERGR